MNKLLQRWSALAPREQWLSYAVALALLVMLHVVLIADPLAQRLAAQQTALRLAETRQVEANNQLLGMQAKLAADPNIAYRQALESAAAEHLQIIRRIDDEARTLVSPARMKALLQDLLRNHDNLELLELESFSAPLAVPGAEAGASPNAPAVFYRHGLRLTLRGGYFELLAYLDAVRASGWRLHWDSLDYRVENKGPGQAHIILQLHTLSRQAGWVGV